MAAFRSTGAVTPIGVAPDQEHVALGLEDAAGQKVVIEFPLSSLGELARISALLADKIPETTGRLEIDPPRLPVWKFELGQNPAADMVLRLHVTGGGKFDFQFDRTFAGDLRRLIGQLLQGPKPKPKRLI